LAEVTKEANIATAEAATKATNAAEDAAQEKAAAAAKLAEVTKAANIATAEAATKATNAAEDTAQEKAAAEDAAQEKAAAAAKLAEVTKATNIAVAAEAATKATNAAEDTVQEKAAAEDAAQEKAAAAAKLAEVAKAANIATAEAATKATNAAQDAAQEKATAAAAVLAANIAVVEAATKAAEGDATAKHAQEKAADVLDDAQVTNTSPAVSSDSSPVVSTDTDTSLDSATRELATRLMADDLLQKSKSPVKSPTKKLSSALKNLESGFVLDAGKRKRTSKIPPSSLLPSAKRSLVMKSEKSTKTSSSSSSKKTSKKTSKKNTIKKTPLSPKGLQAIVNGKDIRVLVKINGKSMNDYRWVVRGSPYFKEHRNAPPEPVGSNLLQNKVTRYRVIINSEWIDQQVYMLMEMDRLVTQIRRTSEVVAPRELWLSVIPTKPSDMNYAYQLLFIMICSSALSDVTLMHYMSSIFDLIPVEPEEVIKMSETELERILHKMGRSNMNAGNILAMTQDVLDNHDGQVPADWDAITKFRGVGRKIASVVAYEAFGISRIPVDVHVLKFAKYFGWCRDNATASKCQEDIEGWMPEINWYRVNSTIGSFCQLAGSNKELLYSEMDRMRIGLINPKFNMVHFLKDYVYWHENSQYTTTK
jgi:endonuclease III